jgi:hypothetical protein
MIKLHKAFKEELKSKLLEIHWRQWSALGVATHVSPEQRWIIDLEALTLSTLTIGFEDKRLFSTCIEWLVKNAEWLNTARFKRIAGVFTKPLSQKGLVILPSHVLTMLSDILRKHAQHSVIKKMPKTRVLEKQVFSDYKRFFRTFKIRDITNKLDTVQSPVLLQLLLRGYYGMDARPDIFIYLLFNKQDNSLSIARNIYYNQKNVYNILEKWCKTGLVKKVHKNYVLKKSTGWRDFWTRSRKSSYLGWTKTFFLFDRILKALSTPPWCEEMYLMSSFFRDLYEDADEVGNWVNVHIPDPRMYKGALYYDAFVLRILEVLGQLLKSPTVKKKNLAYS